MTAPDKAVAQMQDYATDPRLSKDGKVFLKALNSGGKLLETLSPKEAKQI